ncbi:hypothetical protein MNB_SM-3-277 [hydrothermal vent metagenome]|uniref:Uncharacterized protein n=1 Tax=hydrothermal vent metagenome TaxID=652676 RepID=A0A1W1D402_9ZZZZ
MISLTKQIAVVTVVTLFATTLASVFESKYTRFYNNAKQEAVGTVKFNSLGEIVCH